MKSVFLGAFALLVLLSLVARAIRPTPTPGKIPLVWVTDPSPSRSEQTGTFNRLNPAYELTIDPSNLEMQKVIVQSLAGVGPDMFTSYDGFAVSAAVRAGIAWDVTDELSSAGINLERDVWPAARPTYFYEGRAYGFPANAAGNAVWYNKAMFEAEGVPYPSGVMTWEQFLPIAQRMTQRDEKGRIRRYGLLFDVAGNWQTFLLQWGGRLYSPDGTRCTLDSPEALAAARFMHDLIFKYRVTPSLSEMNAMATAGGWGMGDITTFGAERAAMAIGGRWWLSALRQYKDLRLGVVECPHGKVRVFHGYGKAVIINRHSPNRHHALEFFKYMAGRDYNEMINDQADALAPMKAYSSGPRFLHNPKFPQEDFNQVWRDIMNYTVPEQISPFVNGNFAYRMMSKQWDMLKGGEKGPEDVMRTITREINAEIQRTLKLDPELKKRYDRLIAAGKGTAS